MKDFVHIGPKFSQLSIKNINENKRRNEVLEGKYLLTPKYPLHQGKAAFFQSTNGNRVKRNSSIPDSSAFPLS